MEQNLNWKLIPNSTYAVSDCGKVKRIAHRRFHNINKDWYMSKDKILKLSNNNSKKYWRIRIYYLDGHYVTESVHRLVAKMFVLNPDNKPSVNHKDGNKDNNYYTNLEWVTNIENMKHRFKILNKFNYFDGEKCNFSKLTENQVYEIASRIKNGESYQSIVNDYPIGKTTLSELKNGRSWRHLKLFPPSKRKSEKYYELNLELRDSPTTTEK